MFAYLEDIFIHLNKKKQIKINFYNKIFIF